MKLTNPDFGLQGVYRTILCGIVVSVFLTGCISKTQSAIFPTGKFVHPSNANWTLQYNDDGTYIFLVDDRVDATGTFRTQDNMYTDDTEYLPCKDARLATYSWEFDGKGLTFHLVGEDLCKDRRESLDGVAWIKQ
jgi:hypothetical protein